MEFNDKIGNRESEVEPDFNIFITSLSMQAMIFLGEMANPITNETKVELPRAKYLIETISIIREKTKGNLTEEEVKLIDDMLYTLRLKYAEKVK
ncbi:MAG: hypothetical protein AMJ78_05725 [Omnitrophica WOR_2 bacterium SM23_29]|nr:MAG: hypothetical protein AMJ78_05725 [Omnitrophica WOR_2 bacterium SM23_29]